MRVYVYTCECRSRRSLWMGLCLGVKKNIQDTPNYIINGQSVVIVLQVNGNGKLELLLKLQSFPVKKRFFQVRLTSCSSTDCGNVEYTTAGTRELVVLFFFQARFRQVLHVVCVQTGFPNPPCQCLSTGELSLKSPWCTAAQSCCLF